MPISINQITSGIALIIDDQIFDVVDSQHVKPGKGGAFAKVKIKNIRTGQVLERTIKPADKVEEAYLEERKLQLLYNTDELYYFMDNSSFEEISIPKDIIGESLKFLQDNIEVRGVFYNNEILRIELPIFIIAEITYTELGLKGDSSRAGNKPATIDTGAIIQVPLFMNTGDKIKVDTRTGAYVERVK